jgi:signal transduction histidine kinase
MRTAVNERKHMEAVVQNYRKDGTPFWNELSISPVFNESGELINFIGLQRDITERKKLETLRDDLVHMIIHDLRSPLAAICGYLEVLQTRTDAQKAPAEAGYIAGAQISAERLQEMITSVLEIKRLEEGKMPICVHDEELGKLIETAVQCCYGSADGKVLEFVPGAPVKVRCDGDITARVVSNLISNALRFTPAEGRVQVSVVVEEKDAIVMVSDTGRGIEPEYHERIFEKFGQVEPREIRHSTGLGLAFCKLAVQAQGGKIGVRSEPGHGSTFYFSVPLAMPAK